MFLVQYNGTQLLESKDKRWDDIPHGITDVQLIHPILNLSVGLHGYDKYAFVSEGVFIMQGGYNIPRIAELLHGKLGKSYVSIRMFRDGKIETAVSNIAPDITDTAWRNKEAG